MHVLRCKPNKVVFFFFCFFFSRKRSLKYVNKFILIRWCGNEVYSVEKSDVDNLEALKPLDLHLFRTSLELFIDQKKFIPSLS